MIAVVTFRQFVYRLFVCQLVHSGKCGQLGLEIAFDLGLCHAANRCIIGSHTDIYQLVQVTENTQLRELCHSCNKYKTQVAVSIFQDGVKACQHFAVNVVQVIIK